MVDTHAVRWAGSRRRRQLLTPVALRLVAGLVCAGLNSSAQAIEPSTPSSLFYTANFAAVLGFDLRNEQAPVATVQINRGLEGKGTAIDLAIPFKIKQASSNEDGLFRVGAFGEWTALTYNDNSSVAWPQQISFFPVSSIMSDPAPQLSELRGSLYLRNEGQFRRFLYRYPDKSQPNGLPGNFFQFSPRRFDAIAVALPENATRIEVRGKSAIPEHVDENRFARFYPPDPVSRNEPFLDVEYILPPTPWQKLIGKNVAKGAAALSPLIGVFWAYLTRQKPRLRLAFIILTALIYLCLMVLVIGFASRIGETGDDLTVDFALLGLSGVVALVTLLFNSEEEGVPTVRLETPKPPPRPAAVSKPSAVQPRAS